MRSFYSTIAEYLLSRLPLDNDLLRYLAYLQPTLSLLPESLTAIIYIARKLPSIVDDDILPIMDEWKLYQRDATVLKMAKEKVELIDHSGEMFCLY